MQKILLVDLFKGLAIIMIIIVHSAQIYNLPNYATAFTHFGQMGCQIFFIMSAFTLCYSCNNNLRGLYNRIMKILPGYWSIVIINFILSMLIIPISGLNIPYTSTAKVDYIVNLLFVHGLFPTTANNNVVFGGWFIGTLVVFYVLFPYVFKLYYENRYRYRYIIFPLFIFICSLSIIALCGSYNYECSNNSYVYFSFINQLPVFVLGIALFDIVNNKANSRYSVIKGVLILICSFMLFQSSYELTFAILPFVFGVAIVYLYVGFKDCVFNKDNIIVKIILLFNKYSLAIYLTHSFVVYYIMRVILKVLKLTGFVENTLIQYILLLPITFVLVYYLGKLFDRYQQYILERFIKKL